MPPDLPKISQGLVVLLQSAVASATARFERLPGSGGGGGGCLEGAISVAGSPTAALRIGCVPASSGSRVLLLPLFP